MSLAQSQHLGPLGRRRKSYELVIRFARDPEVCVNYHKLEEAGFHVESLLEQMEKPFGQDFMFTLYEHLRSKSRDKKFRPAKFLPLDMGLEHKGDKPRTYVLLVEYRSAFYKYSHEYQYRSLAEAGRHIRWLMGLIRGQNGKDAKRTYVISAIQLSEVSQCVAVDTAIPPVEKFIRPKGRRQAAGGKPSILANLDLALS
jgi:hypothetical protein